MSWVDTSITVGLIGFMILLVWARVQHQTMKDTILEIKETIVELFTPAQEALPVNVVR